MMIIQHTEDAGKRSRCQFEVVLNFVTKSLVFRLKSIIRKRNSHIRIWLGDNITWHCL